MKKNGGVTLIVVLMAAIGIGAFFGLHAGEKTMKTVVAIRGLLAQIIFFTIPLVIFGFIAPAITSLKEKASAMLGTMLTMAYLSAVGAAAFAAIAGYSIIPHLDIPTQIEGLKVLPKAIFSIDIPPIMPVMTALVLAILTGVATIWGDAKNIEKILYEFQSMVLSIVKKIVIPLLPFFVAATFAQMAYTGRLTQQFPVFFKVILIVLLGHFIWLFFLYALSGMVSRKNPWEVVKHYGPVYLTAVGTMSSAATLPVTLSCARKSKVLPQEVTDFAIPLGSTVHLCGSVLTETFFCMTISKMLYGTMPTPETLILFIFLFGIFAVGAPGVPGGTVMASLAIVQSVLGFDADGVGLLLGIFALQDSFGTACNILGDGALALMLRGLFYDSDGNAKKKKMKNEELAPSA
ncbi:MAG: dicarboxylate/amino acid:cation symporter [Synergistota bacterium]|nr:dicarboxylate/amino acid:cation symporter [Synergistota bacterium]